MIADKLHSVELACVGQDHRFDEYSSNSAYVCYMGNFSRNDDPYSHTYNPEWEQHTNFGWDNYDIRNMHNDVVQNIEMAPSNNDQSFSWQNIQQDQASKSLSIVFLLKEYMTKHDVLLQSQSASLRALENQVEQITNALKLKRQETLPIDTKNLKSQGQEHNEANIPRSRDKSQKYIDIQNAMVKEEKKTDH